MTLPEILDIGFKPDEPKLWAVDIPVEEISVSELEHNLDIPYLEREGTSDWNLTPRELLGNLEKEPFHAQKVNDADLNYPIEIYLHKGQWIILDGIHRFAKVVRLGLENISVRRVSPEIAQRTKVSEEEYKKWRGEK